MNKAFIREPELDGRAYCPRCGALGTAVDRETLDYHVQKQARPRLADSAWYCEFAKCDTGYFDQFDRVVSISELEYPVYPKASAAPICACFGFTFEDLEADVFEGTPVRIRELLDKSECTDAQCQTLAANGQCCMPEVQRLYMRRIAEPGV